MALLVYEAMRKMKPFPSRFAKLTLYEKSAGVESSSVILASANSHPYIDPNSFVSAEKLMMGSGSNCRLAFDFASSPGRAFQTCRIWIYNFSNSENILLKLEKGSKVKLEAGYNGFALDSIIEGYLVDKPFIQGEATFLNITTRQIAFMEEAQISLPGGVLKDFIAKIEEKWAVKLKYGVGLNLEAKINIALKVDLEGAIAHLGAICGLHFAHEYGAIFQGFYPNGMRAEATPELPKEIKSGVVSFELYFKEKTEGRSITLKEACNKESFNTAEEAEEGQNYDVPFALDAPAVPENKEEEGNAWMQLFLQGGFRLGSTITFLHNRTKLNFAVQRICMGGDTHGTGADFKTELLLKTI